MTKLHTDPRKKEEKLYKTKKKVVRRSESYLLNTRRRHSCVCPSLSLSLTFCFPCNKNNNKNSYTLMYVFIYCHFTFIY